QPPTTVMDGIQGDYFGTNFNGSPALITAEELDRRALESPQFEITFVPVAGNPDSPVEFAVTFRYIDSLKTYTTPVTLHAALLERGVPNSGTDNGTVSVIRKLLLTGAGNTLTRSWSYGDSETVNISYILDVPIADPDNLYLLAFVQDQLLNSKRLLQTAIIKAEPKNGITVVGLPDDPISGEIRELVVYPNPASQYFNISSEVNLSREYSWQLIDQRGVAVLSGDLYKDFTHGAQKVEVGNIANGIYFLAIQTGEKSIVHKKIAIMNKN
ncbi:MAG TPA: T9SS type A sorting domain-containing protein, partial [Chryseolinea sp.]